MMTSRGAKNLVAKCRKTTILYQFCIDITLFCCDELFSKIRAALRKLTLTFGKLFYKYSFYFEKHKSKQVYLYPILCKAIGMSHSTCIVVVKCMTHKVQRSTGWCVSIK